MDAKVLIQNEIDKLIKLVVSTSLWANPEIVQILKDEPNNENASWYLNTRRFDARKKEERRKFTGDVYLDDNVCANLAIKRALGIEVIKNFNTCHIYDKSTYDIKYHTSIPNLVLVPNTLFAMTDNSEECKDVLKYISFKRYGFYIDSIPTKPAKWNASLLDTIYKNNEAEILKAKNSIKLRKKFKVEKNTHNNKQAQAANVHKC